MSGAPEGMGFIEGGAFEMGSADFYPEERPVREVRIDGFWMDEQPVTVADLRRVVKDMGYVTVAERPPTCRGTAQRHVRGIGVDRRIVSGSPNPSWPTTFRTPG